MGYINVNNKNKRVGMTSVPLTLERVSKLFPQNLKRVTTPGLANHYYSIATLRQTRIITNEYMSLPAELNLNLSEIYRSGILLSEAELEALVNAKLDLNYTLEPNKHPKLKFHTWVRRKEQWSTTVCSFSPFKKYLLIPQA